MGYIACQLMTQGDVQIPPKRAPFYPLRTGLGKHGAILLCWPGCGGPQPLCDVVDVAVR
jgi:hypothetical protein